MVKAWIASHGQGLIKLLSRRFKMRFYANCTTFSLYDRHFLKVFAMAVKMSYVVASYV